MLNVPIDLSQPDANEAYKLSKHKDTIRRALTQPAIPEGYALVPIESTREMNAAADMTGDPWDVWKAMIYASPAAPVAGNLEG